MIHPYLIILLSAIAVGFCGLALMTLPDIDLKRLLAGACLVWVVILAHECNSAYLFRNSIVPTSVAIWEDTVSKSPNKPRPRINLARSYQLDGRDDLAIQEYNNALLLYSGRNDKDKRIMRNLVYMNVGELLLNQGRVNEALETMTQQWNRDPGYPGLAINIGKGLVMHATRDFESTGAIKVQPIRIALEIYDEGIKGIQSFRGMFTPDDAALLYFNKSVAHAILGECEQSHTDYLIAQQENRDYARAPQCLQF